MSNVQDMSANEGKKLEIIFDGRTFYRIPIKTHLITENDNISDIAYEYTKDIVEKSDILFISKKVVAITQNRIFLAREIKVSPLAEFLSKFITISSLGMGLGRPETMEIAIRECGTIRMLFAAIIAGFTKKILRRSGDFYKLIGSKARYIDGSYDGNIPPYDEYIILAPENCNEICREASKRLGNICVAIVGVNDVGANTLGVSHDDMNPKEISKVLSDNPLGEEHQKTPLGIIRELK
ncbi:hypothetical protein Curi_c06350 [Gottschalkia acidurici 9a]|uniref:Coenzyme F420:L-glutamate ligase-like domain-containing protein n=1 Tax=Gottschalkia acidurici (strain ATCC 7906 / DSM 604 / BCRC 14475 / CIP 104303 / KCTC 5404 / NCIMB 10678 / 9a) TaxID=1128398 RepID=K0AV12_GOTA9|nr:coenzyme F420-0:L-glutamate ligase [Gottschalkia acidurici]AFS77708.1 hypothetical protein Curi_c06350 [Gottschalkia acidurici 9a]